MAREYLWLVVETAPGVPKASPVAGTDSIYIRLSENTSFAMEADPTIVDIAHGGGVSTMSEAVADSYVAKGTLKTPLYPSQCALLLGWAGIPYDGTSVPWTESEPAGDLLSMSVYHGTEQSDFSFDKELFSYVKVAAATIEVSRQSTTAMLSLDLIGGATFPNAMDASSFPGGSGFVAPAETAYPTGPYTFHQTSGGLVVGSTRSLYDSLSLKIVNALDARAFEASHPQIIRFCGRATQLDANLMLKITPDDRAAYQALTAQTASLTFTSGAHSLAIDFKGNNHFSSVKKDLPLNQIFMRPCSLKNKFSGSAGTDLTITVT